MSAAVLEGPLGPALLKLLRTGPAPEELATAAALLSRGTRPRPRPARVPAPGAPATRPDASAGR
ncbi:hypothetical protein BU52_10430 [Streptomyces toyocaensis]|uniref:Uncharacterized protein n=1 Tax=Streptomyces toyocaensis TaxID=55952 RepID=A0A081XV40_STRTO|nr:hypothetical protein [Streptomyces toyocaensis]KES07413.1 hypothetical protein BU52_10430 [Streptomyces toyocaensis]